MRSNEVAKLAGVSVRTLRHYHSLGLLPEPPRSDNGYRDYTAADVARVLRIKRLASLGFPLARIGTVLEEMDAPKADPNTGSTTTGTAPSPMSALEELDCELALEIERLQEQRRTIAALRAENLDPDLPVRFSRVLRMLPGVGTLADASPADRTALIVAGHLYDDDELGELERVIECIAGENLVQALEQLDERLGALAPDAPELERAALVDESLETLAPVIACFDTANWLRPSTDRERFLDEIAFEGNNPAQQDVYGRIGQGIEAIMAERVRAERAGGTTEADSAASPRST
ncbi:MerR family transcriptional regulator [Enterorhabdus sp. NM05_H27]|nr:MerR family transcriptional regulator [Enterorhabdus sp. NM05_H27]